jgi:hypothetical protein
MPVRIDVSKVIHGSREQADIGPGLRENVVRIHQQESDNQNEQALNHQ